MKRVNRPEYDDVQALTTLSKNKLLKSYPRLLRALPAILRAYVHYLAVGGRPDMVRVLRLGKARADFLRAHYKSPPSALKHIKSMREKSSHLCCPMCGSLHSGTLDHFLPKEDHPAFAVLSANLVPACKCNSVRGQLTVGAGPGERVLHPYFDDCLSERLIAARFTDLGPVPRIELTIIVDPSHPEFPAITFHSRFVWEKTALKGYLAERWILMCRRPSLVVRALESPPVSLHALRSILHSELSRLDDEHSSLNNWRSIFIAGLLDAHVTDWLFNALSQPGRTPDGPIA